MLRACGFASMSCFLRVCVEMCLTLWTPPNPTPSNLIPLHPIPSCQTQEAEKGTPHAASNGISKSTSKTAWANRGGAGNGSGGGKGKKGAGAEAVVMAAKPPPPPPHPLLGKYRQQLATVVASMDLSGGGGGGEGDGWQDRRMGLKEAVDSAVAWKEVEEGGDGNGGKESGEGEGAATGVSAMAVVNVRRDTYTVRSCRRPRPCVAPPPPSSEKSCKNVVLSLGNELFFLFFVDEVPATSLASPGTTLV